MAGAGTRLHGQCHQHKQESLLVCLGNGTSEKWSCSVHFCFLVAGHTKFAPDRLFASCSKTYNVSEVFNIVDLKEVYAKHCSVSVCDKTNIHTWRKYLSQCYSDLPGVRSLHKFLIVRGEGDKAIFRVGKKCYDPQVVSASMCMTSPEGTAFSLQGYTRHQLPNTKLEDIQQMCHRFIAQSRWPAYVVPKIDTRLPSQARLEGTDRQKRNK